MECTKDAASYKGAVDDVRLETSSERWKFEFKFVRNKCMARTRTYMSKYTTVIFGLRVTFFLDLLLDSYCRAKLLQQIINMFLDFYGAIQMLRVKGVSVFCMLTLRLCK